MLKGFILLLIFESGANTVAVHHIDFSARNTCESAKTAIQAKARQLGRVDSDGKKTETLKLIEAACLEK
jgi:hypothetical protein